MAPPYHLRFTDIDPRIVAATDSLFRRRSPGLWSLPGSGRQRPLSSRQAADGYDRWLAATSHACGIPKPELRMVPRRSGEENAFYSPDSGILMPGDQKIQLFTMFRRHMQYCGVPMCCDDPQTDARAWAASLFHAARPELLARLTRENRVSILRPEDLLPGATSPDGGKPPGIHTDSQGHLLEARLPVFVYGDDRGDAPGNQVDTTLAHVVTRTSARLPFHQLYRAGESPYVGEGGPLGSAVSGELLTLAPGSYRHTMRALDRRAGFRPGQRGGNYNREARLVTAPGGRGGQARAWVYHGGPGFSFTDDRLVPGGDWAEARPGRATALPAAATAFQQAAEIASPTAPHTEQGLEL
jgi:Gamma-glutamyl cyclotransferase, AIG2-like